MGIASLSQPLWSEDTEQEMEQETSRVELPLQLDPMPTAELPPEGLRAVVSLCSTPEVEEQRR
jgi:hypothetical protein